MTDRSSTPRPQTGLVSVVVPAYNRADLIARQLDALASQKTDRPYEVIVADNVSTDATASVARSFADRIDDLQVVGAWRRRGASYARNVGAAAASGEVLAFCDSDDIVHPEWLETIAAAWTPASIVAGRVAVLHPDTDPRLLPASPNPGRPRLRGFLPFADSANLAIGREDLQQLGGFDESYRYSADVALSWRAQLAGFAFAEAPEAVVYKRPAPAGWIRFRQYHRWGRTAPQLYRHFRDAGMPARSTSDTLHAYAAVGHHAMLAPFSAVHRRRALRSAGWSSGYAVGSLRYRVRYL